MAENINYKKISAFYFVGNLFNKGFAFITVPIFTRLLSTSDYGIITTYDSWIAILAMVFGFALHMGVRASFIDYREKVDDFISVITTFTLESGLALSLLILLAYRFLSINLPITLILLCLFQSLAAAIIQNYLMYLMMQYRYKLRTAFMILPNVVSVSISIIVIKFFLDSQLYVGRIVPTAVVNILVALLVIILTFRKSKVFHNYVYVKYGLSISLPLILHGIALNILSQSDRTMITWLADSSQTGIYSLIYNFSMIATVITTSLEGVWVPWFTQKLITKDIDDINTVAKKYINVMVVTLISVILVGPEVVKFLANSNYWDGIKIIPPIVLSNFVIFAYTLYVNIEHFYKKTKVITVNTCIAAATNIALNYLLIPKFGYVAAAYTTLVSYLFSFFLHASYAKKIESTLYPLVFFIKPIIQLCCATIVFYLAVDKLLVRWLVAAAYVLYMIYRNREYIIKYVKR